MPGNVYVFHKTLAVTGEHQPDREPVSADDVSPSTVSFAFLASSAKLISP